MIIEQQPMPEITKRFNTSQRRELAKIARLDRQMGARTVIVQPGDNIQQAINALANNGGGIVLLKEGTHVLTTNISGKTEVSIIGEGREVTIIECSGSAYGIDYTGTSGTRLQNFKIADFTIQNSNNTAGIDVDYCDFWNMRNVKVTSCDQKGIRVQHSRNYIVENSLSSSNTGNGYEIVGDNSRSTREFVFTNCSSTSNGGIGYAINASTNDLFFGSFVSCQALSNTGDGFDFSGSGASALDVSLFNCSAISNGGIGFDVDSNCQRVRFFNCIADLNTGDGFESDAIGTGMFGCYSSTAYDINSSVNFIGNDVAGGGSVDPKSRIDMANTEQFQSFMNLNENTRTIRKYIVMKNTVGITIAAGSPVILKAVATGDEVVTTTTGGDDKVIGVADEAISNNAWGRILVEGYSTIVRANGTTDIAIGDLLTTDTNAGIAKKAGAGDMVFGMALEAYATDDTAGVLDALIFSPRLI